MTLVLVPTGLPVGSLVGLRILDRASGLQCEVVNITPGGSGVLDVVENTADVITVLNGTGPTVTLETPNIGFDPANNSAFFGGNGAAVSSSPSLAVGMNAQATGPVSTAVGAGTRALNVGCVALGQATVASSDQCTSIGTAAQCQFPRSVAVGYQCINLGSDAVAIGEDSTVASPTQFATVVGKGSTGRGDFDTVLGARAGNLTGTGQQQTLIGYQTGSSLQAGNNNTFVGYRAGETVTDGGSNVIIGSLMNPPDPSEDLYVSLAGLFTGSIDQGVSYNSRKAAVGLGNESFISQNAVFGVYNRSGDPTAGDLTALLVLDNTFGANGNETRVFTGGQDPNGLISAPDGSLYIQGNTSDSTIWINVGGNVWANARDGQPTSIVPGVLSANFNIVNVGTAHFIYQIDTTAGPTTGFLPAVPTTDAKFTFVDVGGAVGANPFTVNGNGNNIRGNPTVDLTLNNGSLTMIFDGAGTGQWVIY